MTTSFHPQGDGQAKWMIQSIVQIIWVTICPDQQDWVLQLPMTEFALNSSANKSTGYTPFELIYRHMPQMAITLPPTNLPGVKAFTQCALDQLHIRKRCLELLEAQRAQKAPRGSGSYEGF